MKPDPETIRELCKSHTTKELSLMWGVTMKTVNNWARAAGGSPVWLCRTCGEKKPRDQCRNARRCWECDTALRNGTFNLARNCTECGELKGADEYYISWNKGVPIISSICKTCSQSRWARVRSDDMPPKGALESVFTRMSDLEGINGYPYSFAARRQAFHSDASQTEAA